MQGWFNVRQTALGTRASDIALPKSQKQNCVAVDKQKKRIFAFLSQKYISYPNLHFNNVNYLMIWQLSINWSWIRNWLRII